VAVEVLAGPVIAHCGSRVCVAGGDLHVPHVHVRLAAQIGVGVVAGSALEPGKIGGHCEPQPVSTRDQRAGQGGD
jgi:hypothetical protein